MKPVQVTDLNDFTNLKLNHSSIVLKTFDLTIMLANFEFSSCQMFEEKDKLVC